MQQAARPGTYTATFSAQEQKLLMPQVLRVQRISGVRVLGLIASDTILRKSILYAHTLIFEVVLGYHGAQASLCSKALLTRYRVDKAMVGDPYASRGWKPIDDLNRTDADVTVFYLNSNGMRYTSPVSDPFFYAQREIVPLQPLGIKPYAASNLTSVLACTDQYQIQNPNNNMATELTAANKANAQAMQIGLNNLQAAALLRLVLPSYDSLIFSGADGLSSAALRASDTAYRSLSVGLPDNQWQIEVSGWFNASLARLQQNVIEWVSKDPKELDGIADIVPPTGFPDYENMCQNQIVKNVGQYQTFSVTAIIIIFSVGLFIIVLSWVLEPLMGLCERFLGREGAGSTQWLLTSPLQLQRLSLVHDERISWTKCDSEVPITGVNQKWIGGGRADYVTVHVEDIERRKS